MNKKESRVITEPEAINTCCTNNRAKKLLNFARLHHNVSGGILGDNIFEPTILLETIISDLERLESRIDLVENIVVETALGVAIEKN